MKKKKKRKKKLEKEKNANPPLRAVATVGDPDVLILGPLSLVGPAAGSSRARDSTKVRVRFARPARSARPEKFLGTKHCPRLFATTRGRLPVAFTERGRREFEILYKSGLFTIFISLWFFILINQLSCFYFSGCGIPTSAPGCSHSRGRLVLVAARLLHHSVLCLSLAG